MEAAAFASSKRFRTFWENGPALSRLRFGIQHRRQRWPGRHAASTSTVRDRHRAGGCPSKALLELRRSLTTARSMSTATALRCTPAHRQAVKAVKQHMAKGAAPRGLSMRLVVSGEGTHLYLDCLPTAAGKEMALQVWRTFAAVALTPVAACLHSPAGHTTLLTLLLTRTLVPTVPEAQIWCAWPHGGGSWRQRQ